MQLSIPACLFLLAACVVDLPASDTVGVDVPGTLTRLAHVSFLREADETADRG